MPRTPDPEVGSSSPTRVYIYVTYFKGERGGLVVKASDSESRGRGLSGVRARLGSNRVVSLSKAHLLPKKYW